MLSTKEPSTSLLRSIERVGSSKDQLSSVDNSHTCTIASRVTVTRQQPLTPRGCHRAARIAYPDVSCVDGPRFQVLALIGDLSLLDNRDESGMRTMWTVFVVTTARRELFGEVTSWQMSPVTGTFRI